MQQTLNDNQLVTQIKNNNSSEALKDLEFRHSGICNQMIKKYEPVLKNSGIDVGDIYNDKIFVVYKSALNFNPEKNVKFSTWLGNQMRYYCLNLLNKNNYSISMDNENIKNIVEKNQSILKDQQSLKENADLILNLLKQMKDKRMFKIFKLRYFSNKNKSLSWHTIGKKLNISTQTAINIHNKALKLIANKINSKNYFDKI